LQEAIERPGIDAIWALRGGYGTMRLLPRSTWRRWTLAPKAFIGFSDNTAVHLALLRAAWCRSTARTPAATRRN
jgi:muramoyltetrapeptide carboxypeptidase